MFGRMSKGRRSVTRDSAVQIECYQGMVQNLAPALGKQVTAMPQYNQFQPKPYRPRMSAYWYFDRWPYLRFILREASSFFVAYFAVLMLVQIAALNGGPTAYANFEAFLRTPLTLLPTGAPFLFLLLHP